MNKGINRKFTLREIILMLVLVVVLFIGLYFLLVYRPVNDRINELNDQIQKTRDDELSADIRLITYNRMKDAAEEIKKLPEDERTYMHKHTDEETAAIITDLGDILKDTSPRLSYGSFTESNGVVRWPITFDFTLSIDLGPDTAYNLVWDILYEMTHRELRRCQLGNITLTPGDNSGDLENAASIHVSGSITFFELPDDGTTN